MNPPSPRVTLRLASRFLSSPPLGGFLTIEKLVGGLPVDSVCLWLQPSLFRVLGVLAAAMRDDVAAGEDLEVRGWRSYQQIIDAIDASDVTYIPVEPGAIRASLGRIKRAVLAEASARGKAAPEGFIPFERRPGRGVRLRSEFIEGL